MAYYSSSRKRFKYGTIASIQTENTYHLYFGKMSLFPAYSDGDSVSSKCNEQEVREGYAVDTGLFCFKALEVCILKLFSRMHICFVNCSL